MMKLIINQRDLLDSNHEQDNAPEGDIDDGIWVTECYTKSRL